MGDYSEEESELREFVETELCHLMGPHGGAEAAAALFADVGGMGVWRELLQKIKLVQQDRGFY